MNLINKNIKFLFEYHREKENRKKIDFCEETSFLPPVVSHWIHNGVQPRKRSLDTIAKYFNDHLRLTLTPEVLRTKNLEKDINKYFIISHDFTNLMDDEKECLKEYRRLSPKGKETIRRLLKDFE